MYNTICKILLLIILFTLIPSIVPTNSEEYWTGTVNDDWSGSVWYSGGHTMLYSITLASSVKV